MIRSLVSLPNFWSKIRIFQGEMEEIADLFSAMGKMRVLGPGRNNENTCLESHFADENEHRNSEIVGASRVKYRCMAVFGVARSGLCRRHLNFQVLRIFKFFKILMISSKFFRNSMEIYRGDLGPYMDFKISEKFGATIR